MALDAGQHHQQFITQAIVVQSRHEAGNANFERRFASNIESEEFDRLA